MADGDAEALEEQIHSTLDVLDRCGFDGLRPLVLLERAGLFRLRRDPDACGRDLAEARRLFDQMGVTGWDAYARSIEG